MAVVRPNVFSYHDYREFLRDHIAHLKAERPRFSMRKLCAEARISPSLLSLIIAQKRALTPEMATKLLPHLELDESASAFFIQLIQLSEAQTQAKRFQAFQRIKRFQAYQEHAKNEIEAVQYLSKWYIVALRELVRHPDFSEDLKWIQKKFSRHVPANEIKAALEFLLTHKFLVRDHTGQIRQSDRDVNCESGIFQLSLNQFHKMILDLGKDTMDSVEKEKRHFSGYTFAMNPQSYLEAIKIIDEAKQKIRRLEARDADNAKDSVVYHAEFMMIPLTEEK